jgi:hypothetical protein
MSCGDTPDFCGNCTKAPILSPLLRFAGRKLLISGFAHQGKGGLFTLFSAS